MEEVTTEKVKKLIEEAQFTYETDTEKIKNEKTVKVAVWRVDNPPCLKGKSVTMERGVDPNTDGKYKEMVVSTLAPFYCN